MMMRSVCGAVLFAAGSMAGSAGAAVLEYQPGLGTMPSAQGWTYNGAGSEIGAVSAGQFNYGPTATAAIHFWNFAPGPMDFSTQTWSIEARVRLTDTFFGNNSGFRRGGFVLMLEDDFGRGIVADIGSAALGLRNNNTGLSDPSMAFDLSSAFHVVRLEAGPTGGRLLIDGMNQLNLGFGSLGSVAGAINWGESSILAYTGLTEIGYVSVVPAPGALAIAPLGALVMMRRRR